MFDERTTEQIYEYMAYQFDGFSAPNGTYVPDEVFDILAPELSEAELRVLLYIIRRTFGFKKNADDISLKQMTDGIMKKDGTVLDRGTGMSKSANWRGIKGLLEKGVIVSQRNSSSEKGDMPTSYGLRFKQTAGTSEDNTPGGTSSGSSSDGNAERIDQETQTALQTPAISLANDPVFSKRTPPCFPKEHPRVLQENTQNTVWQQTDDNLSNIRMQQAGENQNPEPSLPEVKQKTSVPSAPVVGSFEAIGSLLERVHKPAAPPDVPPEEARDAIRAYLKEIAGRFNDQAPLESSVSRACNLYNAANLSLGEFLSRLLEVSSSVRERRSKVKKQAKGGKATMPYFFACLADRLGLRGKERGALTNEREPVPVTIPAREVTQVSAQYSPHRTSSPRGEQGGNGTPPHTHSFARPVTQSGLSQSGQSSVYARSASAAPS